MSQTVKVFPGALKELCDAVSKVRDPLLIEDFLNSLLTKKELAEVSSRWALVRLIDEGVSQRQIASRLGLSLCKITRGSKELKKENSSFSRVIDIYKDNNG
ncbi:MAG: transcriptional regulator [Spirochaetales bacterium]|nr:MAG: transcriptional regulator [Spirochaetales bacterium]